MRALNLHLKILIILLVGLGSLITAYQIFGLNIALTENKADDLWNIEVMIEFQARPNEPVKLQMQAPPTGQRHALLNESFISNNYGVSINTLDNNRRITWSSRRASGKQALYYRLLVSSRENLAQEKSSGPTYRESLPVDGIDKIAAQAMLASIRQNSADVETFISETIQRVNDKADDNARLLLGGDNSSAKKAEIINLVLSIAHVPVQRIHTIRLEPGVGQTPELWLRSYNGKDWLYFNPQTGAQGLPDDRFVWWLGDEPLLNLEGGLNPQLTVSLDKNEINAIRLASMADDAGSRFLDYSLYALPFAEQQSYHIMLMIPVGVLIILVLRNIGGLQTLGTFTPVLIALAFRETELLFGIVLFTLITMLGLSLRSYLEHLKLQMLPRLSVVLTFVVILFALISLFSHKLGLQRGLSVTLFPMVILTMTIERLSITWEERGANHALKVALGTLLAASLAYFLMSWSQLSYLLFTFPGILLVMMGFMLAMGRYRGYRLTELIRFKALLQDK